MSMTEAEQAAFLDHCAAEPSEYHVRMTQQCAFVAGRRSWRAPGDTGNAAAYVAMGRDEEGTDDE